MGRTVEDISICGQRLCSQCDYHTGVIVDAAQNLLTYADRHGSMALIIENSTGYDYRSFMQVLQWFANQDEPCGGCRTGGGWSWWPDCPVRECCLSKEIYFCFKCGEFPCDALLEGDLLERKKNIIAANKIIGSIGVAEWLKRLKV
ncbi:MAG: DUF3795 domain-containing protein [Candidatus Lokiarchaeota archaeon]|nr:DUF3795 domain-containing protein [Candidatus Lokiarchaeota archaeon]